jgi:hypothetical protein
MLQQRACTVMTAAVKGSKKVMLIAENIKRKRKKR